MNLQSLLHRTLVLVAHPDDEAGGCGVLLQRIAEPIVVFATDGAPNDHWFWTPHPSRAEYAAVRRAEARAALDSIGVRNHCFLPDRHPDCGDQRLYRALPAALQGVVRAVLDFRPQALLVPAFEGGHPDHDACNFLGFVAGNRFGIPVWEMPLYHRLSSGPLCCQQFLRANGSERVLRPRRGEWERKRQMLACYTSQPALPRFVPSTTERYRPLAQYDYSRPPHDGMLNYEAWHWPMSGTEVADAFTACLRLLEMNEAAEATATPQEQTVSP
jgi:LmbE family N-acetylglucosaminyl deacetylase